MREGGWMGHLVAQKIENPRRSQLVHAFPPVPSYFFIFPLVGKPRYFCLLCYKYCCVQKSIGRGKEPLFLLEVSRAPEQ